MGAFGRLKRSVFLSKWAGQVASGDLDPTDWQAIPITPDGAATYIPIPKAANTTLRTALLPCFSDAPDVTANIHHHPDIPVQSQKATLAATPADAFVFTVVRHPADRIYSTWRNKMGRRKRKFNHAARLGMARAISFDDFLAILAQTPAAALDSHFKPQTLLLHHARQRDDLQVFKAETIDDDWPRIAAAIAAKAPRPPAASLGRLNTTAQTPKLPQFTATQQRLITHLYADDFEAFTYDWSGRTGA